MALRASTRKGQSSAGTYTNEELALLCRKPTPQALALFYEWAFVDSGFKLPSHLWPVCLALCDQRIRKFMFVAGPGTGKSQLLSVAYPAMCIGLDPTQTVIAISGAENLAQGFMQAVMGLVEHSEAWKSIFPNVKPDKAEGWSSDRGMYVTGRKVGIPDSTFWAGGLNSRVLPGKHAKTIIMDDLHTDENSLTEEQCDTVVRKYYNTILGRADPQGSRSILAGRRWNEKDLYGHLRDSEDWVVLQLPAERAGSKTLYHDVFVPDNLECVFTDGFCECSDGSMFDAGPPP